MMTKLGMDSIWKFFVIVYVTVILIYSMFYFLYLIFDYIFIYERGRKDERRISKRKNFLKPQRYIKNIKRLIILTVIFLLIYVVNDIIGDEAKRNYIYVKNELGRQTKTSVLFYHELQIDWGKDEALAKLHILDNFIGKDISSEMFSYYEDLVEKIYIVGEEDDTSCVTDENYFKDLFDYFKIENNKNAGKRKEKSYIELIQEAEGWWNLYQNSSSSTKLYQLARALNDAVTKGEGRSYDELLRIASGAILGKEDFLKYKERNIGGANQIIVSRESIILLNGKCFANMSSYAEGSEETEIYADCMLVQAYCIMDYGRQNVEKDNEYYVIFNYYVGNLGERLVKKLSSDNALYQEIGRKAKKAYESAQKELNADQSGFYKKEQSMSINIADGIATLTGLGF